MGVAKTRTPINGMARARRGPAARLAGSNTMGGNVARIHWAVAVAAAMLAAAPAAAAVITRDYVLTANFIQQTAPVKSLTLGFTLAFDPELSYLVDTPVLNYTSSSALPQFNQLPIVFKSTYYPGYWSNLQIGGGANGSAYLEGTDDFFISLSLDAQGAPVPGQNVNVEYNGVAGVRFTYNTRQTNLVVSTPAGTGGTNPPPGGGAGAVPEPATWAMMLMGFGLIGRAIRHQKDGAAVKFA
jgi:hypothetical protein